MKKKILLFCLLANMAIAQVGINTITPHPSSILDIESTTHGLLIPRFSSSVRDTITNTPDAFLFYNTSTNYFQYRSNNIWYSWRLGQNVTLTKPIINSIDVTEPGKIKINYAAAVSGLNQSVSYQGFTVPGSVGISTTSNPLVLSDVPFGATFQVGIKASTASAISYSDLSSVTIPYFYTTPVINTVSSTNDGFTVNFSPSVAYDGSTTAYEFLIEPGTIVATATASPATITGLTQATNYTIKLRASGTSTTGKSLYSNSINATTLARVPDAPSSVTATAGNGSAIINFVAPNFSFANSNLSYEVTVSPGNIVVQGTSSPITVYGLDNNSNYTFSIKAVNHGVVSTSVTATNAATSSATVTPNSSGITLQPLIQKGDKELIVQWQNAVPSATYFEVAYKKSSDSFWKMKQTIGNQLGLTLQNLTNNVSYDIKVRPVNSGSQYAFSPVVSATPQPVEAGVDSNLVSQLIVVGQSLAGGGSGGSVLSTTQPFENLALNGTTSLVPLVASTLEFPGLGLANQLSSMTPANNRFRSVLNVYAIGNTAYWEMKKGTQTFTNALNGIRAANSLVNQTLNKSHKFAAIIEIHGENDHFSNGPNPILPYQRNLEDWQRDYQTDASLITGQLNTVPLFSSQNANWQTYVNSSTVSNPARPTISLGQLNAVLDNPDKMYMVGPRYPFDYNDLFHMTNYSYRRLGEYYGKAVKKVLVDKEPFLPLYPLNALQDGNTITINFHVPVPPLQWDTVGVLARENYGFEFLESPQTATITNVALGANGTSVIITLSNTPIGDTKQIAYAARGVNGAIGRMNANAPGGNLTDSDTTPAYRQDSNVPANMGNVLKNWCVTFMTPVYNVNNYDSQAPVITLSGSSNMTVTQGNSYTEPGYTAVDNIAGDITNNVVVSGVVNTAEVGTYQRIYKVKDFNRNWATVTRTIQVVAATDTVAPVLQLVGTSTLSIPLNTNFVDPGCTANDAISGNVSANISVTGAVNTSVPGTYTLTYNVSDEAGNAASSITRTVIVTN
jgi:hypothetical protein